MPATDGGLESESTLGVLIILFLVVASTIYVFMQQQQQPPHAAGAAAPIVGAVPGQHPRQQHASAAPHAIPTSALTDKQLRLHRSLPSRNGARTITICADALIRSHDGGEHLAWISEETPRVLADLLHVADVYVLCKVPQGDEAAACERVRRFLTASDGAVAANEEAKSRGLKLHKILFCTTSIGKVAFVRQLEPQVHVERDVAVVRDLEKHVPRIIHVVPTLENNEAAPTGIHHVSDSFATYFHLLGAM